MRKFKAAVEEWLDDLFMGMAFLVVVISLGIWLGGLR